MDWLFNGINDFFQWWFRGMEALKLNSGSNLMNTFLILSVAALTIYWMIKMVGHAKQEKQKH